MLTTYVLTRLARAFFTLWLVVSVAFFALRLSGNPVEQILPDDADPELVAYYSELWGVDMPILEQYGRFWIAVGKGDLGQSFLEHRDALETVLERVPQTLSLMTMGLLLSIAIGIPTGIYAALRRNSWADKAVMGFAVSGHALPNFFLGIMLILIFAVYLKWLPTSGRDSWSSYILPVATLGTSGAGALSRFTRGAVLQVIGRDFVRAARARGHDWPLVIRTEVLPNAALPVLTVLGFMVGGLIGGAVITETVFAWPGVGRLLVHAVAMRDFAVVQAVVLLTAATMVTSNFVVDILHGWLDPRLGLTRKA